MDWLDLLAVQGTLKSLLQHHSSKASILQHSAFFIVQLSHPYMTTGKTIALTRWAFVYKVTSLLFNMLSRLVITTFIQRLIKKNFFFYFGMILDKFRLGESHFFYSSLLEFLRYLLTILPSKSLICFFFCAALSLSSSESSHFVISFRLFYYS